MTAGRSDPTKLITRIAAALSLLLALGLPAAFLADEYEEFEQGLQLDADALARRVNRLVAERPEHWKYLSHFDDILSRDAFSYAASQRVVDSDGKIISKHGDAVAWPAVAAVSTVYDSGAAVGQVVVERSLRDLALEAAIVTLLGALFGGGLFAVARTWPLRALRRAIGELEVAARAFENTADSVIIYDPAWRVLSVNRAFTAVTGYESHEVLGKTPEWLRSSEHGADFYSDMRREVLEKGRWRGEMTRRRKDGALYPTLCSISAVRNERGEITNFVSVFNDVSSFKEYEKKLEFMAHYDALTQLPNRTLFLEKLREALLRAKRQHKRVALLFIDLDQFKTVNDSLGHHAGDALLRAVAQRLLECLRETDAVARQGGDEFTVMVDGLDRTEDAGRVAEKVLAALAQPVQVGAHELAISGSVGISCYPHDGDDTETLLKNADAAMYRAKEMGRNNYQFFSADLNARASEILVMKNNLRLALQRDEFILNYQPCYNLASGRITGLEALVRWQHPELGLVSPAKFIPLAEDTGMIVPLGEWVIQTACAQMKQWQVLGIDRLRMAVNVSPRQFRMPQLAERIASILRETGLAAEALEVEITEGVLMHDQQASENLLHQLKSMGIAIAIDDFGAGYSSLSYLKRFPVDYLKIDRAFVSHAHEDAADVAIVRAIIALARGLNLATIAEGVELEEQRKLLMLFGCDHAQGFFFSRPRPAHEIEQLLAAGKLAA